MSLVFTISLLIIFSIQSYAWNGFDHDQTNYIEIDKGELVREGETIEFFDYNSSEYRNMDV